jgi:hypothetical protein
MVKSYFSDRYLQEEDGKTTIITCGVPQGSVLGPLLWNLLYDDILNLTTPEGVELTA